jgi:NitT/TauT family transport system ATP-binding protein
MSATVTLEKVNKLYTTRHGTVKALEEINLSVSAGQFVALVGPSGCGKSTIVKLVAGLHEPTQGQVIINDQRITQPYTDLGIVFQEPVLLDWKSVLDNVLLQAKVRHLEQAASKERALKLLEQAGLAGFELRRPYELSGGMRQRAAVCRALLHRPPLLLMDEPFGALDALTREQMAETLQTLWLELRPTVLFVTHSIPEAVLLADRVIVMSARPGRIIADISIDLPRPRTLSDIADNPQFVEPTRQIRHLLEAKDAPHFANL